MEEKKRGGWGDKLKSDPNFNNTPEATFPSHMVQVDFSGNFHMMKAQKVGTHLDDCLLISTWQTLRLTLSLLPLSHHLHNDINLSVCFSMLSTTAYPHSYVEKRT